MPVTINIDGPEEEVAEFMRLMMPRAPEPWEIELAQKLWGRKKAKPKAKS